MLSCLGGKLQLVRKGSLLRARKEEGYSNLRRGRKDLWVLNFSNVSSSPIALRLSEPLERRLESCVIIPLRAAPACIHEHYGAETFTPFWLSSVGIDGSYKLPAATCAAPDFDRVLFVARRSWPISHLVTNISQHRLPDLAFILILLPQINCWHFEAPHSHVFSISTCLLQMRQCWTLCRSLLFCRAPLLQLLVIPNSPLHRPVLTPFRQAAG
jgi:hypothetical protein